MDDSTAQVLVFPAWRDNPYLNLLGLAAHAGGRRFLGATTYDSLLRQADRLRTGDVLHVHWTSPLLQEVEERAEADSRLEKLQALFEGLRARGIGLVWTVHNRLPHELRHPDAEVGLYRALARSADAVHVMAPSTPAVISDVVTLNPTTVRIIPHASYEGIYDSAVDRVTARDSFDLRRGDRAVLFLGQIRPYKGVDALLEGAAHAAQVRNDLVLMLAGVVKGLDAEDFVASIPENLRTITQLSFVDDGDIARWFRAADVVVLPYRAILNSGSLHLAATFRRPVLLPDERHLREQFGAEPWIRFFDVTRPAESIGAILAEAELFAQVDPEDFERFTRDISPWATARRYAALLEEVARA